MTPVEQYILRLEGGRLSEPFPVMAKNPTSRGNFVSNAMQLVREYGFDGVDIDWEYPGYAAHGGTPDDTESFNYLMRDLRLGLDDLEQETGKKYGLTAALPCGPSNIKNIDVAFLSDYINEFNLMTYDFHGAWDSLTGVNSPLYDQSNDPEPGWSVDGCVKNWASRGAPKDRLNIGLGFYGRSFKGATELKVPHGGNDDYHWEIDEGSPQYFNIMDKIHLMTSVRDEETMTQYAYFNEGGGLVSFDDVQSICDKTEYAMDNALHGYIIWELSGDVMKDLNTPLLDVINRKLVLTETDCAYPYAPVSTTATTATTAGASTAATMSTTTSTKDDTTTTTTSITTSSSTTVKEEAVSLSDEMVSSELSEGVESSDMQRKPVRRRDAKPERPYRPPKHDVVDL